MTEIAVAAEKPLKLDLACGQTCQPGFEGVDICPCEGVKHVVNLWRFPWPFETSSVDEIFCSHHVEHIPMVWWGKNSNTDFGHKVVPDDEHDQDLLFAFFDECYRILKPGGVMRVIVPHVRSDRAFQDPTHRRFLPMATFLYLSKAWRDANRLDHYCAGCDFEVTVQGLASIEEQARHAEVAAARYQTLWNVVPDLTATLIAKKGQAPLPPVANHIVAPVVAIQERK